jgi:hypothetical protein
MIVERPSLERRLTGVLEAGRIAVLLGGCASGRTSLLFGVARTLGPRAQYLDLNAVSTTPERCWRAVELASRFAVPDARPSTSGTARAAFDRLLSYLDEARSDGHPVAFLLDDFLSLRTFESFPGLRHAGREAIDRLAASQNSFLVASRFTSRMHRALRDATPRYEVVHVPPIDAADVAALARRQQGARGEWAPETTSAVAALSAGRAGYADAIVDGLAGLGPSPDAVAALALLFAPDGRLTARCRESYELRLHRARGDGALKAILGILADDEPQNLTEIAQHLRRTPGSTKDYLSWLEDVDLVAVRGKRYTFDDPLLRVYVRLYGRPAPPTDGDIVREVRAYAAACLPAQAAQAPAPVVVASADSRPPGDDRSSGIIEID